MASFYRMAVTILTFLGQWSSLKDASDEIEQERITRSNSNSTLLTYRHCALHILKECLAKLFVHSSLFSHLSS